MSASLALALALAQAPSPAPAGAPGGAALAAACAGREGWSDAAPPATIAPGLHYVGTCGISVLLLTSPAGHVLIDGAAASAVPSILANIRALGVDPRAVKLLLVSHAHVDHAGGLAALKRATGARLLARAPARAVLESGRAAAADPQAGAIPDFTGVAVDRIVRDGERLRLGPLVLTPRATPGHTAGGTSWTWRDCSATPCTRIVYADSLTAVSADGYRFADHPALVATFRASFDRVAALDCDLLLTPHPSASALFARLAGAAPLRDSQACRDYADAARRRLDERLAGEVAPR